MTLTWTLRLAWTVGQEPIHRQCPMRERLYCSLRICLITGLQGQRLCHRLAARLVEPHQGLPLARMGRDPFPRQVPHRLDAASPRIPHRRRASTWPAARAVVAIAGAHPVPFQFPAGRGSDIEVLQAHQAPGHQHR